MDNEQRDDPDQGRAKSHGSKEDGLHLNSVVGSHRRGCRQENGGGKRDFTPFFATVPHDVNTEHKCRDTDQKTNDPPVKQTLP